MARRLTTNQEIPGSTPGVIILLPEDPGNGEEFLLMVMGRKDISSKLGPFLMACARPADAFAYRKKLYARMHSCDA